MTPLERAGCVAHSRTLAYQRRVDEALRSCEQFLAVCRHPAVSYSAGKDSEVLLHLLRRLRPDLMAVWSDDEFNLPETLTRLDQVPHLVRIAARIRHAEWFVSWADGPSRVPVGTEWVEAEDNNGLGTWAAQHGVDGMAIALRAEESHDRRRHLRTRGLLHQLVASGRWHCYATGWWTAADVWAYLVTNEVPYNRAYDRLSEVGVPLKFQRIGPFAVQRVLGKGQLGILRLGWPREFEAFATRFPEARQFV